MRLQLLSIRGVERPNYAVEWVLGSMRVVNIETPGDKLARSVTKGSDNFESRNDLIHTGKFDPGCSSRVYDREQRGLPFFDCSLGLSALCAVEKKPVMDTPLSDPWSHLAEQPKNNVLALSENDIGCPCISGYCSMADKVSLRLLQSFFHDTRKSSSCREPSTRIPPAANLVCGQPPCNL